MWWMKRSSAIAARVSDTLSDNVELQVPVSGRLCGGLRVWKIPHDDSNLSAMSIHVMRLPRRPATNSRRAIKHSRPDHGACPLNTSIW